MVSEGSRVGGTDRSPCLIKSQLSGSPGSQASWSPVRCPLCSRVLGFWTGWRDEGSCWRPHRVTSDLAPGTGRGRAVWTSGKRPPAPGRGI